MTSRGAAQKRAKRPSIVWANLHLADGGDAKRVAVWLRRLRSADEEEVRLTLERFAHAVLPRAGNSQDACTAAPAVVEALVALASDRAVLRRPWLLGLAFDVLASAAGARLEPRYRDAQPDGVPTTGPIAIGGTVLAEAARSAYDGACLLLADEDPRVRATAATLVGTIFARATEAVRALAMRLADEDDDAAAVSEAIALHEAASHAPNAAPIALNALVNAARAGHATVRGVALAAAASLARSTLPHDSAQITRTLSEMLVGFVAHESVPGYSNPQHPSVDHGWRFQPYQWAIARLSAAAPELQPAITDGLVSAARSLECLSRGALVADVVGLALASVFPERSAEGGLLTTGELTAAQSAVITPLSEVHIAGPFLRFGLSPEVRSRRRQLGLDPEGPLEALIVVAGSDRPMPSWRVVEELLMHRQQPWQQVHAALLAAAPQFRPRDLLRIWFEVYARKAPRGPYGREDHAYGVLYSFDATLLPGLLATTPDDERLAWAKECHDELRRWPQCLRGIGALILRELVVRKLRPGEELPEEYDQDLGFSFGAPLTEVLAVVPRERRACILSALAERGELSRTAADEIAG